MDMDTNLRFRSVGDHLSMKYDSWSRRGLTDWGWGQLITDLPLAMCVIETYHVWRGWYCTVTCVMFTPGHPHTAIVPMAMTNEVFTPDVSPGPSFAS